VLLTIAAASLAMGGVLATLPPALGAPEGDAITLTASTPPPRLTPFDPTLAEDVVIANVFSARRSPPPSRYTPPGTAGDSVGAMADVGEVPSAEAESMGGPRLLGTVVTGSTAQALLQLDPAASSPRLYMVGDRDAGYRVVSITPRAVVLSGPRGRVTLQLDPQEERP